MGWLEVYGSVAGAVTVRSDGTLALGASPGQFTANVTRQSGATVEVEHNSTAPGTLYDQVRMGSGATLTLSVILGFSPTMGDTFQIVSSFSMATSR